MVLVPSNEFFKYCLMILKQLRRKVSKFSVMQGMIKEDWTLERKVLRDFSKSETIGNIKMW